MLSGPKLYKWHNSKSGYFWQWVDLRNIPWVYLLKEFNKGLQGIELPGLANKNIVKLDVKSSSNCPCFIIYWKKLTKLIQDAGQNQLQNMSRLYRMPGNSAKVVEHNWPNFNSF